MTKQMKIQFAPGCFDHFDGTQEELDQLVNEIQTMFENASPEDLEEMSRPLSEEEFDELPEEIKAQLLRSHNEEDLAEEFKRKLQ